jgi:hypothetical protein
MHPSFQISQAELLLLLGILQLPLPLALGDYAVEHDVSNLGAALAAAAGSLAARELLHISADGSPPHIDPELATLVTVIAQAEACLIHTATGGDLPRVQYLCRMEALYVAHSCPRPGIHRLSRLVDQAALLDLALTDVTLPETPLPDELGLTMHAEPLTAAFDALSAGDLSAARARLLAAGAPARSVHALSLASAQPFTRHAFVALQSLDSSAPQADSALLVVRAPHAWLGSTAPHAPDMIALTPVDSSAIQARVAALAAWMG